MNNTLDSIRPSDADTCREDMSYLFGRDPSILAYGQRCYPLQGTKKNLISLYDVQELDSTEENPLTLSSSQIQTVKVYLRMKPIPRKLKLTEEQQEAYKITNSRTLSTKLPVLENNSSFLKRSRDNDFICRKFTFTQTFGPETTQVTLFEEIVRQQLIDFLSGKNCTVMTYGTTNSGKSYTLQGTTTSPGIIPRSLEYVFSNITPKALPSYKAVHHCDVVVLDALERAQEIEAKTKLLTFGAVDKNQYVNTYKQMQKLLEEESPIRPSQTNDSHYSVWVSFAEIYNEIIYDLLSNECQKKRTPLKLATDSRGRPFIKGLKTICVNSGSEAYQVLMAGQYNLKVAATALNARSSRSHCIFTIKLLKYCTENAPDSVEVSTFAFCDLAGSERLKKTLNIGDRLKEAQNINTSLLVLGRCLKSIHEGQITKPKNELVAPFRESKLTRLFQRALSGREQIILIVNVNPIPNLYVETQNVLTFSAIAKKIVLEQKVKVHKRSKSRFSQIVTQSIKTVTDWDTTDLENAEWQDGDHIEEGSKFISPEDYADRLNEIEELKAENASLKNTALTRDLEIRREMADTYTIMLKNLEAGWKSRIKDVEEQQEDELEWSVKRVEDFYKQKLDYVNSRKRRRSSLSEDNEDEDPNTIKSLEIENCQLTEKIVSLKNTIKELRKENHSLYKEKNTSAFELAIIKEDLKCVKNLLEASQKDLCTNEDTSFYIDELKLQLCTKEDQVKNLKEFLNEAKQEYIAITTEARNNEIRLKEQEQILMENDEQIADLEAQLEHSNICLTEKTKAIETLEDKVDNQCQRIFEIETNMRAMQEKMQNKIANSLCNVGINAMASVTDVQCQTDIHDAQVVEKSEDSTKEEYQEIIVKEEIITSFETESGDIEHVLQKTREEMETKVHAVQVENSVLREKLEKSDIEILSLTQALELANTKLANALLSENNTKIEITNTNMNIIEGECEINDSFQDKQNTVITSDSKHIYQKGNVKEKETARIVTKDEINQTSFIAQSITNKSVQTDTINLENVTQELTDLRLKYNDKLKDNQLCTQEHESKIAELEAQLSTVREDNDLKAKCLANHSEKISELEENLKLLKELQKKVKDLDGNLEMCHTEKNNLQKLLSESNGKASELEHQLSEVKRRECEKDYEIMNLQKEVKHMIQASTIEDNCAKMEVELKDTLKKLTHAKETLHRKEEVLKSLEMQVKTHEQNANFFNLLQQDTQNRQSENERLRNVNDELKNSIIEKEREMEAFKKNRDETVTKYENLVKSQQDDIDRQKREVMRYQELFNRQALTTNSTEHKKKQKRIEDLQDELRKCPRQRNKENFVTTSEDEEIQSVPRTRRRKPKYESPKPSETPVIELSGSESKYSTKSSQAPSSVGSVTRSARGKRLFIPVNESFQDVEPIEIPTPQVRTLRTRRK